MFIFPLLISRNSTQFLSLLSLLNERLFLSNKQRCNTLDGNTHIIDDFLKNVSHRKKLSNPEIKYIRANCTLFYETDF